MRMPPVRASLRRWLARYLPPEAAGFAGAVLAAGLAAQFGGAAVTAFAGAIGEAVAFYAVVVVRDLRQRRAGPLRTLRDLTVEFAPAELLDTFAVRPLAMYLGPLLVGNLTVGVALGKVAADVVFYAVAIVGYELRRPSLVSGSTR
jgi:hypothetical protein